MSSVSAYLSPVPHKEFSKKKRTSKVAKLKQCRLDVRREQWLSQVKVSEIKPEPNDKGKFSLTPTTVLKPSQHKKTMERNNKQTPTNVEDDDLHSSIDGRNLEYLLITTKTNSSDNVPCYKEEPCSPPQLTSSGSSNSSCWSLSSSDDDCLDDWEAMADALTFTPHENKILQDIPIPEKVTASQVQKPPTTTDMKNTATLKSLISRHAWSANDALRPHSLPNISNKMETSKECDSEARDIGHQHTASYLTCCPICCEDLDITDSSFQPCTCGFLLCLFCHNRILEAESRCPGCRKQYSTRSIT